MAWLAAESDHLHRTSDSMACEKKILSHWPFIIFVLFCSALHPSYADLASDAAALLAFKSGVVRQGSSILPSWNSSVIASICISWEGVTCTENGSQWVTSLRLPGKSLTGTIPERSLGNLALLDTLSLRSNRLSGSFPADLGNCAFLRRLYLQRNNFSGPLPTNFSLWPQLEQLDLSENRFTGSIPSSIENMTSIRSLFLQNNSLSGEIPLTGSNSLNKFSVAYNQLNGSIPRYLQQFGQASFAGNVGLCGPPLQTPCAPSTESPTPQTEPVVLDSSSSRGTLSTGAIVGIVFACIVFLLISSLLVFVVMVRKPIKNGGHKDIDVARRSKSEGSRNAGRTDSGLANVTGSASYASSGASKEEAEGRNGLVFIDHNGKHSFDLQDLLRASAEVLGKGSLGTTYKAMMDDGLIMAVKRLRDVTSDKSDFTQHIEMLGRLHHTNLVELRAYYFARQEKLLVFDFMPNGSVSALLHGNRGSTRGPLAWESRLAIAGAVATGVEHLHAQELAHANIKSANVLLGADNVPRLCDYGLVQLVTVTPGANSHKSVGYLAPEVTDVRKVSMKADVYSVGVVLLELLTGRSPTQAALSEDGVDLPRWVKSVVREECTAEVFDSQIMKEGEAPEQEMVELLQIALPCVSSAPDKRPAIAEVARSILNLRKQAYALDPSGDSHHYELSSYQHHHYPGRFSEIS